MKNYYCHLSHKEKIIIYEYLYQGCSIQEIATVVDYLRHQMGRCVRSYETIYRFIYSELGLILWTES